MSTKRSLKRHPDSQRAIDELKQRILAKYPTATFHLSSNPDEPGALDLLTYVDSDDPDLVLDCVMDRILEMQFDEGIPIHVVPMRR